ncbi:unnamed protein product [Spirodela intermedia]|uniref:Uncharacterized protein n=1 Tax=Spirodela intermedia TaxID=51605 RepID=A0A7I8JD25_SPIIN|nr:unnamed protein product [Spirodela intermedia]CAA6668068.1 unnamed protein product [Spirodela intermedia]
MTFKISLSCSTMLLPRRSIRQVNLIQGIPFG